MEKNISKIKKLYLEFNNNKNIKIVQLKQSGSYREYYRITSEKGNILGVYNPDRLENDAFLSFSKHFKNQNLNVPKIIAEFTDDNIYFIEDLGDTTLYDFLKSNPTENKILDTYQKVVSNLIKFQIDGIKGLDTKKCYPRESFDIQSIMWDLNYFKYFVLKVAKVTFNEQKLEEDFYKFGKFLASSDRDYFLYRDFQSKNIMLVNETPYFIDYQGGRKGAFYYDLASLLFDSKANLSEEIRNELKDFYFELINEKVTVSKQEFNQFYNAFALIRILQAFGAYGFRGIVERKLNFIASIPKAISNVNYFIKNQLIPTNLPELTKSLNALVKSEISKNFNGFPEALHLKVNSFSFIKGGYPENKEENGGGFVFDCRFLPNPGRFEYYKKKSGVDKEVIEYLQGFSEVETFISDTIKMILNALQNYVERGFTNLEVNFGCTGGRHRSVYCAETSANILKNLYGVNVSVAHLQKKDWGTAF